MSRNALFGLVLFFCACGSIHTCASEGMVVSASYYLPTGDPMANGEAYNPNDPKIAAGPAWLFGRKIRLTQQATGRSIEVLVKDRMPDIQLNTRRVDLTPAAFRELADLSLGRMTLMLQILP